ncbi:MAG: glycosyltransferase family 8 protein [Vampirovibrionales bacterium]
MPPSSVDLLTNPIHVCLACDDAYAPYAGVVFASILATLPAEESIVLHLLHDGLSDEHQQQLVQLVEPYNTQACLMLHSINEADFEAYKAVRTHDYIPLATYYRLRLASLLPEVNRVIYLDCDMVVNTNIALLYRADLQGKAIGGVLDISRVRMNRKTKLPWWGPYVNAGMLVIDLARWRSIHAEARFLAYALEAREHIFCGDQQIINVVLADEIQLLDKRWNTQVSNFMSRSCYTSRPFIVHYIGGHKPWKWGAFTYFKPLYFKYLQQTPWRFSTPEEATHWQVEGQRASFWGYWRYRPLIFLHPKFWWALCRTYLTPLFGWV